MSTTYFNFTKSNVVDLNRKYDTIPSSNEPKLKGYFIALLVKPDLNLWLNGSESKFDPIQEEIKYNSEDTDNTGITKIINQYNRTIHLQKLFKGLINAKIIANLTHCTTNYFSSIFSNKIESISYPDVGSNSEDSLLTLDKYVYKLPVTETGVSGMSFNVRLRENEGIDCLRMLSVWHKYIHAVTKGIISPKQKYISFSVIDYKASLYIIHLKPDLKTITMWSKYTGIYPTTIPISAFSEDISTIQDVTIDIEFSYDRFEWMNEDLLKEINYLTSNKNLDIHNKDSIGKSSQQYPFIYKVKDSPFYQLDLNGFAALMDNRKQNKADFFGNRLGTTFNNTHFVAPLNLDMLKLQTQKPHRTLIQ